MSTSEGGTSEAKSIKQPSEYDILAAGKELETIKAWIDEQNELVKKRQAERSKTAKPTTQSNDGVEEEVSNPPTEVVRNGTLIDSVPDKSKLTEAENDIKKATIFDEDDRTAWYEEQNRLVEERRIARLEAERQLKDKES